MALRETAWRVSARELAACREEERGTGERAATYVLSPYGARMNRVLLAGTLSAAEPLGRDQPPTFWRAHLADPLGRVAVTAGSFQPRAMAQLRAAPPGRPALVVGKLQLYRGGAAEPAVSVRAEGIRSVPEAEERAALADIVRQSLDRLDLLERLENEPAVADDALRADGYPRRWIASARACRRRYPGADRASYRAALRAAIGRIAGTGRSSAPPAFREGVTVTVDPPPPARTPPTEPERAEEAIFLDLVDRTAEGSEDGYADVREVLRQIAGRGVPAPRAEAVLGRLEEGGVLEEPIVGKLRRA